MAKIELNSRDLQIKTLDDNKEVIQIKGMTAFDDEAIIRAIEKIKKALETIFKNEAIIRASVRYKDIEKIEEALETIFKDIKRKENCE